MTDVQKFVLGVVGGIAAIVIGLAGLTDPPLIATGTTLSVAFVIAGLAVLGVGPIATGYGAAKASDADRG